MLSDKWLTYLNFKKYCPTTCLINSEEDLKNLDEIRTDKVVAKPLSGSGGENVKVISKEKIKQYDRPFLVQEFIPTKGIHGIVNGPHDLRVVIRDDTPFYSFVRTPKEGKYVANLAEGGSVEVLKLRDLPKSVYEVIKYVCDKLKKFEKKLYAIDFIFDDNGRAWILEMNSRPGIALEKEEQGSRDLFYGELIKFLTK